MYKDRVQRVFSATDKAKLYKKTGSEMAFLPIASLLGNRYNRRKEISFHFLRKERNPTHEL